MGSVRQLVDASGNVTLAKDYQPYGEVLESIGNSSTAYGFTSEWTDSTGLVYLRARYYDPALGRFVQADTIVPRGVQGLDRYAYVGNNPLKFTDPSGHATCDDEGHCWLNGRPTGGIQFGSPYDSDSGSEDNDENWIDDSGFDNESNSISDWGSTPPGWTTDGWRIERARRIWNWLCSRPSGCPNLIEVTAWLLFQEGAVASGDDFAVDIMARAIRYRLGNEITPEALSGFTAFINPNSGGSFNKGDWDELNAVPSDDYLKMMKEIYSLQGDYVYRSEGEPVIYWWYGDETGGSDTGFHVTTVAIDFGPPIQNDQMYFGNYSQCNASGFVACP